MKRFLIALCVLGMAMASAQTVTYITGNRGRDVEYANEMAAAYMAEHPGVTIEVVQGPQSATDRLQQYLQFFEAQSSDIDVFEIDVIWPGDLAEHLVNLYDYPGFEEAAPDFFPAIVANNTVGGALVGMPYFTDAGLLYYRSDLLEKYGYDGPPATWAELEEMSVTIQAGERADGNVDFWGYVWQGNAYEGLTCDALEWITSFGGGEIVEVRDSGSVITVNNEQAVAALEAAKGWVGTISPPGVTGYQEEEARGVWHAGNAAFMRNWPYAYSLTLEGDVGTNFGVAALPAGDGEGARSAATLGGWQLAVSKYSDVPDVAADFALWLTSHESQVKNAVERSLLPTRNAVYEDDALLTSDSAFMADFLPVFRAAVARPSTATAPQYGESSALFFAAVHSVLTGEDDAETALALLELDLQSLTGFDTAN